MGSTSQPYAEALPEPQAPGPLVKRYSGVVRAAHWLNAVFLVGMIASGLQIYNAYTHFGLRDHPRNVSQSAAMATRCPTGPGWAAGSPAD